MSEVPLYPHSAREVSEGGIIPGASHGRGLLLLLPRSTQPLALEVIGRGRNESLLRARHRQLLRGGLVFKAHRLLYHSTLGLRVIKKQRGSCVTPENGGERGPENGGGRSWGGCPTPGSSLATPKPRRGTPRGTCLGLRRWSVGCRV